MRNATIKLSYKLKLKILYNSYNTKIDKPYFCNFNTKIASQFILFFWIS